MYFAFVRILLWGCAWALTALSPFAMAASSAVAFGLEESGLVYLLTRRAPFYYLERYLPSGKEDPIFNGGRRLPLRFDFGSEKPVYYGLSGGGVWPGQGFVVYGQAAFVEPGEAHSHEQMIPFLAARDFSGAPKSAFGICQGEDVCRMDRFLPRDRVADLEIQKTVVDRMGRLWVAAILQGSKSEPARRSAFYIMRFVGGDLDLTFNKTGIIKHEMRSEPDMVRIEGARCDEQGNLILTGTMTEEPQGAQTVYAVVFDNSGAMDYDYWGVPIVSLPLPSYMPLEDSEGLQFTPTSSRTMASVAQTVDGYVVDSYRILGDADQGAFLTREWSLRPVPRIGQAAFRKARLVSGPDGELVLWWFHPTSRSLVYANLSSDSRTLTGGARLQLGRRTVTCDDVIEELGSEENPFFGHSPR